ncbi:uncharacterized protein BDR25DRAFT_363103 [Lindgomyces ingoldianus]|uniref:Uncharacterized protein n=1 Tax=Lindgomyces ingoldianus TaxID=673940 RepID=A0ACB6Q8E8_9PLEO|nr:uncharacterized protein BDR25DRAFT_363103 [Lindgomyces ingoldianus]KAF2463203.1 hypothetical protein BDR25DRAFT_363103 [Lindgomyces ingoldianus]
MSTVWREAALGRFFCAPISSCSARIRATCSICSLDFINTLEHKTPCSTEEIMASILRFHHEIRSGIIDFVFPPSLGGKINISLNAFSYPSHQQQIFNKKGMVANLAVHNFLSLPHPGARGQFQLPKVKRHL